MEKKVCSRCRIGYPLFMFEEQTAKVNGVCKQCLYESRRKTGRSCSAESAEYYDRLDLMVYVPGVEMAIRQYHKPQKSAKQVQEEYFDDEASKWKFESVHGHYLDVLQDPQPDEL